MPKGGEGAFYFVYLINNRIYGIRKLSRSKVMIIIECCIHHFKWMHSQVSFVLIFEVVEKKWRAKACCKSRLGGKSHRVIIGYAKFNQMLIGVRKIQFQKVLPAFANVPFQNLREAVNFLFQF